jgi:site-specific DNA recombinase
MGNNEKQHKHFVAAIRKFMAMDKLTAPLLRELINHITVYETEGTGKNRSHRIIIHYRFIGVLDFLKQEPKYTANTRKGVAVKYVTETA